jgi:hypothetical protein
MPETLFLLDLETDAAARHATLRLRDGDGIHIDAHEVALDAHAPSLWAGLFDTRRHVARMKDVEAPEAQLAALGRFLGESVLGPGIVTKLAEGVGQRTVLVRLPDPTRDDLAAAFARVRSTRGRTARALPAAPQTPPRPYVRATCRRRLSTSASCAMVSPSPCPTSRPGPPAFVPTSTRTSRSSPIGPRNATSW